MNKKSLTHNRSIAPNAQIQSLKNQLAARLLPTGEIGPATHSPETQALLLDRSGSMALPAGDKYSHDGPSRIEELRKLAGKFPNVRKFQYNHTIQELKPGEEIGGASGGNNEVLAFTTLKHAGIKHVILLTDGGAVNAPAALKAAIGLRFEIFYFGPPPAPKFLHDLARQSGGSYQEASLAKLQAVIEAVKAKLLIAGPQTEKGIIKL